VSKGLRKYPHFETDLMARPVMTIDIYDARNISLGALLTEGVI